MKKKKWLILLTTAGICLLLLDIFAGVFFYRLVIERGPKDFLQGNEDLEVSAETMDVFLDGDWIDWTNEQPFETLELTSFDDLSLKGYYLPAEKPTNRTVVLAHGYLGNGHDMGLFGEYYYEELGYNIFMPDLRGHGNSSGDYYGFGWHDRVDILDWIDKLIEMNGPDTEIVLHGLSMGAATVVMASGEPLPNQVKAVIADSAYTSVYELFQYQLDRMFHLPDKPILPTMSMVTKLKAGYGLKEASALEQAEKAKVPILYISGAADSFVPARMTEELYEATPEAEWQTFPNANHGESIVIHEQAYLERITAFLEDYKLESHE